MHTYDIAIIGAGTSGLTFARSLKDTNLRLLIIEKSKEDVLQNPPYDGREFALTHLSHQIMKELDIWQKIPDEEISLIKNAKVVNGDSDYALHFSYTDTQKNNLGFMTSNHLIRKACHEAIQGQKNLTLMTDVEVTGIKTTAQEGILALSSGEEVQAKLIVAADSRFSKTRKMMNIPAETLDFKRTCIVFKMDYDGEEQDTAMECFHYGRTLAVLPLTKKRCSVVLTIDSDKAHTILEQPAEELAKDIATRIDHYLGKMTLSSPLFSYPLVGVYAQKFYGQRYALLGDTAVGMHPVTAHGFNIGLRGAYTLAKEIKKAINLGYDIGSLAILQSYHTQHRQFSRPLYLGTNLLVKLYTNESTPAKFLRHGLIKLGNTLTPAKNIITGLLTETDSKVA